MTDEPTTRTRILHSAIELMGREGPDRFSASALAREVGVSKATLFHHFDSMDEIPLAALEEVFFEMMDETERQADSLEHALDYLWQQAQALVDDDRFLQAYFVFFIKGMFDQRFRDRLAGGMTKLHRRMVEILYPHLGGEDDPEVASRLVEVMLDGFALHMLMLGDRDLLNRAWRRFTTLLIQAQREQRSTP